MNAVNVKAAYYVAYLYISISAGIIFGQNKSRPAQI